MTNFELTDNALYRMLPSKSPKRLHINLPSNNNRDIIQQCVYDEQKMAGTWSYGGQLYQLNSWYS